MYLFLSRFVLQHEAVVLEALQLLWSFLFPEGGLQARAEAAQLSDETSEGLRQLLTTLLRSKEGAEHRPHYVHLCVESIKESAAAFSGGGGGAVATKNVSLCFTLLEDILGGLGEQRAVDAVDAACNAEGGLVQVCPASARRAAAAGPPPPHPLLLPAPPPCSPLV